MANMRYSVTQAAVGTLFTWIESGDIAIPEIQRPFVWDAVKVRNLLDSLFQGFPVGYLITWRNPDVKLKDGTVSAGRRILIDGQQRVTALMAALLGREVINKNYQRVRLRIAFHPGRQQFEVSNSAIQKDAAWIPDIAVVFDPQTSLFDLVNTYCDRNPGTSRDEVFRSIEALRGITANQIGLIELDHDLDIETVTEIFIRVNSEGVPLSQADFAMSKIAVNETYGGNMLRKAIDYFCHLAVAPEFFDTVQADREFARSEFFPHLSWLRQENDDLYDPSYTDMLRVAFTSEFRRGRLEELVALLSGRNFETRQYEEAIVEESFAKLKNGILRFMNETHFKRFLMIIRSAGFVDSSMVSSQNTLNFAYILYLTLRDARIPDADIERYVRRWFIMSILTGRYSAAPETAIDYDIRQIQEQGIATYAENVIHAELSDTFWESLLPQLMTTSVASSPYFRVFQAAQVKMNDRGFLSQDISVRDLIEVKSDLHHIFPRHFLKSHGMSRGQYNQIANYAVTQSEINIAIGSKEPGVYFRELREQCQGGPRRYGNITDLDMLRENLRAHCIPEGMEEMTVEDYPAFLAERRKLMARKIRRYFESL
ncbi:GmrSD restriction endonuclease domain-containing protein [Sphaerobacter thermophilus]|uniref:GmrSD restriction endonucleases N-terminal domain-containing protein n=1 Tax=Sphaerobacter thermophilus (strain ATCC 49802 / DSM 20745 / KCCM 41009 / NCIMB 13125 / S 6022) TaxID=479434 RepID=D1C429_SPHTD|nr:DUF262 domain-containing protein [Sphaerobacter thermophilus]ACZ38996.1 protein of unknown function DUF262 [Sphaerobacter thermophilus DSM 20745]